jgi:periplasmic protein TonB
MATEGLRRHLTGAVPISIALHLVALFMFLAIPLTARIVLPMVAVELPEYVRLAPMPPPPEVASPPRPRSAATQPSPDPATAPTSAPATIQPETVEPRPTGTVDVPDSTGGLPPGMGGLPNTGVTSPVIVPPPPEKPSGPIRVAQLPVSPAKTFDVRPIYPEVARIARIEGTVLLEAVLDPTGRVTQLRVIKSAPMFDQAAQDAVRQWRYTPSTYGGHPVSVLMTITIRFTLK